MCVYVVTLCWRDVCGMHDVHCNICLGDGFHPPSCSTPAETNHMEGSEREHIGHSMCTSDAWRHRDSMRQCSGDLYSVELSLHRHFDVSGLHNLDRVHHVLNVSVHDLLTDLLSE